MLNHHSSVTSAMEAIVGDNLLLQIEDPMQHLGYPNLLSAHLQTNPKGRKYRWMDYVQTVRLGAYTCPLIHGQA